MARRTFFSFHYELDVQRASVVRKSSVTKPGITAEWIDASLWEEAKGKSKKAIQELVDDALNGTSVTAVLIGSQTASRDWVQYEIDQSIARDNGLLGIYIHNVPGWDGKTAPKGANPLPPGYRTYDWVNDDGYNHLGTWVDTAYDLR